MKNSKEFPIFVRFGLFGINSRRSAYAYSRNNPIVLVDSNGYFFGDFGRDLSSGQRQIASFLHKAAENTSSQGGFINRASGFVTNSVGDFVDNMADVWETQTKTLVLEQ